MRVSDTDVFGAADPAVLAWAAAEERVLLTHDVATMTASAYERVRNGQFLAAASQPGEYEGQVLYLPL